MPVNNRHHLDAVVIVIEDAGLKLHPSGNASDTRRRRTTPAGADVRKRTMTFQERGLTLNVSELNTAVGIQRVTFALTNLYAQAVGQINS